MAHDDRGKGHNLFTDIPDPPAAGKPSHYHWTNWFGDNTKRVGHQVSAIATVDNRKQQLRESVARQLHPEGEDRHAHPNPKVRRHHMEIVRSLRDVAWRAEQIRAALLALDPLNDTHYRWLFFVDLSLNWADTGLHPPLFRRSAHYPDHSLWDLDHPWTLPSGIPLGEPRDEEREEWALSLYDFEQAAMLELEIGMGGPASVELVNDLNNTLYNAAARRNEPFTRAQRFRFQATRVRVAQYLDHWHRRDHVGHDLPADPYNPYHWGHDNRLEKLSVQDDDRQPIEITPDFDPDTLEYASTESLENAQVLISFFDPFLEVATDVSKDMSASLIKLTVTSKAGEERIYTVTQASP